MMNKKCILSIDPGNEKSAFVCLNENNDIITKGLEENGALLTLWSEMNWDDTLIVIERIASYGMPVGKTIFESCFWTGRFIQFFIGRGVLESDVLLVPRMEVKNHLCHSSKAKDSNVRQALVDRFGEPGTKKNKGKLYGVKKDIWAALALGITVFDTRFGESG